MVQRRQLLAGVGIATIGGLAGCSSSGNTGSSNGGNESDNEESPNSTSTNQGNEESQQQETQGNEPGEYPTQETTGLMAEADQIIQDGGVGGNYSSFAFRIDDYDFLNIEQFPDILDGRDESSLLELVRNNTDLSYQEALYVASEITIPSGTKSDNMYFAVPDARDTRTDTVIYVNLEDQEAREVAKAIGARAPNKIIDDPENRMQLQAEFLKNHIDPDGIVHAVDLAEHDYAVEALHSGFGSE
jgi:hypothetical protein